MGSSGPPGASIGRVALRVADVATVADFYEAIVGLERYSAPAGDAAEAPVVLGSGGETLLFLLPAPDAPARDSAAAGLFHVAVRVPTRAALGSAVVRLREADALTGAADHLVSEAVYATDPEGNGVEVYVDRPREDWQTDGEGIRIDTLPLDLEDLVAAVDADDAAGLPAGTDVGHVHLEVTDLDAARRFYVDDLGMALQTAYGDEALFVADGGYHHHVGLNIWNDRTAPVDDSRGLAWFEVRFPDASARDAALERLAAADVERRVVEGSDAPTDGADAVAVLDPDGVELRLSVGAAAAD